MVLIEGNASGRQKAMNKIFGIGLSRTGTHSLNRVLNELGFRSIHFPDVSANIRSCDFNLDRFEPFDAMTDTPIASLFRELDVEYPNSKFILTVKDKEAWLASCQRYFALKDSKELGSSRQDENEFFRLFTYGCIGFDRLRFSGVYDDHHHAVQRYFSERPDDLLVVDVKEPDARNKIHRFLDAPPATEKMPHEASFASFRSKSGKNSNEEAHAFRRAVCTVIDAKYVPYCNLMLETFSAQHKEFAGDIIVFTDEESRSVVEKYITKTVPVEVRTVSSDLVTRARFVSAAIPQLKGLEARFYTLEAYSLFEYDQVVFLDADMVFVSPAPELFDISKNLRAAPDSCYYLDQMRDSVTHRKIETAFSRSYDQYISDSFNSGVMSIPQEYLSQEIYEKLTALVDPALWQEIEAPKLADQIVLNRAFTNEIKLISSIFNFVIFLEDKIFEIENIHPQDIRIVHYAGPVKPWRSVPKELFNLDQWKWVQLWRRLFRLHLRDSTDEYRVFVQDCFDEKVEAILSSPELAYQIGSSTPRNRARSGMRADTRSVPDKPILPLHEAIEYVIERITAKGGESASAIACSKNPNTVVQEVICETLSLTTLPEQLDWIDVRRILKRCTALAERGEFKSHAKELHH